MKPWWPDDPEESFHCRPRLDESHTNRVFSESSQKWQVITLLLHNGLRRFLWRTPIQHCTSCRPPIFKANIPFVFFLQDLHSFTKILNVNGKADSRTKCRICKIDLFSCKYIRDQESSGASQCIYGCNISPFKLGDYDEHPKISMEKEKQMSDCVERSGIRGCKLLRLSFSTHDLPFWKKENIWCMKIRYVEETEWLWSHKMEQYLFGAGYAVI